jgi:hypothetical protein
LRCTYADKLRKPGRKGSIRTVAAPSRDAALVLARRIRALSSKPGSESFPYRNDPVPRDRSIYLKRDWLVAQRSLSRPVAGGQVCRRLARAALVFRMPHLKTTATCLFACSLKGLDASKLCVESNKWSLFAAAGRFRVQKGRPRFQLDNGTSNFGARRDRKTEVYDVERRRRNSARDEAVRQGHQKLVACPCGPLLEAELE